MCGAGKHETAHMVIIIILSANLMMSGYLLYLEIIGI